MFRVSSMKLGLDQVVLQGMEGSGKNTMSKDEMDKLLKNGAYDIFKEGSGEKESNDFVSQDIDSILANRTTTIIHDSNGSTFSKATFKVTQDDTDINDPDFWTK